MDFYFNLMGFVSRLSNMGVGMLVIFVVIGLIILTTLLINWLFSDKKYSQLCCHCGVGSLNQPRFFTNAKFSI